MNTLSAIQAATAAGNIDGLRKAFGDSPNFPNARDECGQTVLDHAIYNGSATLVRALLDLGADPSYDDPAGLPSLFAAIDRGSSDRLQVLALLLAAGANVEQRGLNDYTALHYAACRNDADAVEMLLEHGANPDSATRIDHYATPLEEAERFGHANGAAALRRLAAVRPRPDP